ncbi:hypothetical protein AV530_013582 [Patagioenas fasciata monilis]|uniref:Cytochrome c oxidase subunit 8B, mitochondrial n=1 Tax=Patagioenas fasciata monilis TaxID=372326 RepID=A0A1V4JPV7_PATFA|nr:hypothetical protein AV530_013582 [Patagioenas fasciata monilis]
MRGFQGAARLLVTALRTPRVPRAGVTSKPPEHPLSAAEQAIALSVMAVCFLGPTAWILAHVHHYRSHGD